MITITLVVITIPASPSSWLSAGFLTRVTQRMPFIELELLTLLGHMRSKACLVFFFLFLFLFRSCSFPFAQSLIFCVVFCQFFFFVTFLLVIVLSGVLPLTCLNDPFVTFKLFITVYLSVFRRLNNACSHISWRGSWLWDYTVYMRGWILYQFILVVRWLGWLSRQRGWIKLW